MADDPTTNPQTSRPAPNEKLVKVFDSEQESEVMIVKGLLDAAGIDSDMAVKPKPAWRLPGLWK